MALISYTQLQDNTDADAEDINSRFGQVIDQINGNIDSENLRDGSVTREKLANGSVTTDKLNVRKYVDGNGWTVVDYGTNKDYYMKRSILANLPAKSIHKEGMNLPEGITSLDSCVIVTSIRCNLAEATVVITNDNNPNRFGVTVTNNHQSYNATNFSATVYFWLKVL